MDVSTKGRTHAAPAPPTAGVAFVTFEYFAEANLALTTIGDCCYLGDQWLPWRSSMAPEHVSLLERGGVSLHHVRWGDTRYGVLFLSLENTLVFCESIIVFLILREKGLIRWSILHVGDGPTRFRSPTFPPTHIHAAPQPSIREPDSLPCPTHRPPPPMDLVLTGGLYHGLIGGWGGCYAAAFF